MRRCSQFGYGADTYTTTVPVKAWIPGDSTVGGRRVSAAGIPAAYVVRRDGLVDVALRFPETEWEDVLALITFGQSGLPITWWPEAEQPALSFQVYLEAPAPGEKWQPARSAEYPRLMEVTLTLRGTVMAPWLAYFE